MKLRLSPKIAMIYLVLPPLIIISNLCGTYLNHKLDITEGAGNRRNFLAMAEWIKNNTAQDAAFASMDPAAVYLFAERKSIPGVILLSGKLTDHFYALKKAYVIVSPVLGDPKYTIRSIGGKPDNFELVFTQNGNQIYRLRNGGS